MRWFLGLALLIGVLSGCGGGGGAAAVAPEPEVVSGPMRLQGQVRSPVIAANGSGLSVFGFAGTISKAYWTDTNPTRAEGEIVFGMATLRDGRQIVACEPDGSNLRVLANFEGELSDLEISPDGAWVYFADNSTLKRVPMAGGNVTTMMQDVYYFELSPSGTKVLALRPTADDVVFANVNGTGVDVRLSPALADPPLILGVVNDNFGFIAQGFNTTSPKYVRISLSGAIQHQLWVGLNQVELSNVEMHPSRDRILSRYTNLLNGDVTLTEHQLAISGPFTAVLRDDLPSSPNVFGMAYSPDGQALVAVQEHAGPNEMRIVTLDRDHNVLATLFRGSFHLATPAWAPGAKFRTFVGAGNYASGAAAVLFSDLNDTTPSVVLADANPRSSMNLTRVSGDNDGTIIFEMTCDALTKLHYTKSNSFAQVGVIGSLTGLKGAIVAFNATTGRVNNVITFTKKPTVSRSGEKWVVEGEGIAEHLTGDGERRPTSNRVVIE